MVACASSPVTAADLAAVASARNSSGYQCVFPHHRGYRVRVDHVHGEGCSKGTNVGGRSFPTPREAAAALVRHLRGRYGDRWAKVFAGRKKNPWRVRRVRPGLYRADVWPGGRLVTLTHRDVGIKSPGYLWSSHEEAKAAIRAFVRRSCGPLYVRYARLLFWRPD